MVLISELLLNAPTNSKTKVRICAAGVDKPAGAAGAARRQLQFSQAGHGLSQSGHYSLERNLLTKVAKTLP